MGQTPGAKQYFDYRIYVGTRDGIDPVPLSTGDATRPFVFPALTADDSLSSDRLVCFDGNATLVLNRAPPGGGQPRARVYPGRYSRVFLADQQFSPADLVWGYARGLEYAGLIQPPKGNFTIESDDVVLNGLHAIKLTGTALHGRYKIALWVCPDRGFLPIRVELQDTSVLHDFDVNRSLEGLVELKPGVWYPRLIVDDNPNGSRREMPEFITLDGISIDPLPADAFQPKLPIGTRVVDTVKGVGFVVGSKAPTTQETEKDLIEFMHKAEQQAQQRP